MERLSREARHSSPLRVIVRLVTFVMSLALAADTSAGGGRGRWAGERVASPTRSRRGSAPRCTSGLWSLGLVRLIAAKPVDLILERRQKPVVGGQRLRLGREGCFVLGELGFEGGSADGTGFFKSADIDLQLG